MAGDKTPYERFAHVSRIGAVAWWILLALILILPYGLPALGIIAALAIGILAMSLYVGFIWDDPSVMDDKRGLLQVRILVPLFTIIPALCLAIAYPRIEMILILLFIVAWASMVPVGRHIGKRMRNVRVQSDPHE